MTEISSDIWGFTIVAVCGVRVAYETPGQVNSDVIAPTDKSQDGVFGSRLYTFPFTNNCPCSVCDPVHVFPETMLNSHHCVQRPWSSGPTVIVWPIDGVTYGVNAYMWGYYHTQHGRALRDHPRNRGGNEEKRQRNWPRQHIRETFVSRDTGGARGLSTVGNKVFKGTHALEVQSLHGW